MMKYVKSHKMLVSIISAVLFLVSIAKTYLLWSSLGVILQVISIAFIVLFLVFAILPWFLKDAPKS